MGNKKRQPLSRPLTARGLRGRRAMKRALYAMLSFRNGVMIALGKEQPLVRFTVEGDPPSVYVVWRIRPEAVDTLPKRLGLADWMASTPIRCLADDEPEHLLVLNYYRVSGLARGVRAEWSIFIADPAGIPRYLVFDACSAEFSIDPVDLNTKRSPITHRREGDTIVTSLGEGPDYTCSIEIPADAPTVKTHAEWATANDEIYWTNGIADRTFYNAGMHDPLVVDVPSGAVDITDDTGWADLVEPDPAHVLVYENAIELAMAPWANLDQVEASPERS